jgi:MerR family transcriptional regulator, heat shock protein HspR
MSEIRYPMMLRRREREQITLDTLAAKVDLHPTIVERFVDCGLLEPEEGGGAQMVFNVTCIARVRTIVRLRRDLGVNLAGIGVILDLLDRLAAAEQENTWLRHRR